MHFDIKEWRKFYDRVNELGKKLRDSRPTYDDEGRFIYPVAPLSKEEQFQLEDQIASLTKRSGKYLDQCGLKMPRPLWHYDRKDCKTWRSHESFKYEHLLEAV